MPVGRGRRGDDDFTTAAHDNDANEVTTVLALDVEGTTHGAAFHRRGHDRRLHLILLLEHQQPLTAFVDSDPLRHGATGSKRHDDTGDEDDEACAVHRLVNAPWRSLLR